ncbi:SDR family NAD(P)-dependent oxidoreductase [Pyruvatibacter mobilis]|uniref:SDR family NAD(P)-dependent oxidoreductase n=1 Tax=Pyruvatibacter mobilis TaxID=1712261 RepID=UPI003BB11EE1
MDSFDGKVVVITGGATGIGFSFAKRFGEEGARLVIAGRRKDRVDEAVAALEALGYQAAGTACDVAKRDDVEALADFAWSTFGQADVLLNNAGVSQTARGSILTLDLSEYDRVYGINIYGMLHGIQVFGTRFVEQGTPAAIYNVGSENSFFPAVPGSSAYISSKHAVLAITEQLAEDVPEFIDVLLITPGWVVSEMTDGFPGAMETDRYTAIVMPQLKAGHFFAVSHAYNMVHIDKRHDALRAAFDSYAPRYDGDDEFDVRTAIARAMARAKH